MNERDMNVLTRGSHAAIVKEYLHNELLLKKERMISEICAMYKAGSLTHDMLIGKIGELSFLNDMMHGWDRSISSAQKLEERMTNNV